MNDHIATIVIPQQNTVCGAYLTNYLKLNGFHIVDEVSIRKADAVVIFNMLDVEYSEVELASTLQLIDQTTPLFIIQDRDHSTTLLENEQLKKDNLSIIEIDLEETQSNSVQTKQSETLNEKHMTKAGQFIANYVRESNDDHSNSKPTVGVVGLGYVGLPVAVGFSKKYRVIGFDIDKNKINDLQHNNDPTAEVSKEELMKANIQFTNKEEILKKCDFIIVAVPTPITANHEPNLTYIEHASEIIGRQLQPYTIVVYESTVFPGTTESVCIPILEEQSNLIAGVDFHVGYSPERLNPGDRQHTFEKNSKIVSGQNEFSLHKIYELYQNVLEADVYKAPSIQVAEAAKIVENAQRDINIAFMNELAITFNHLNINTKEVLKAASTKWNFQPYSPGLVGGHCIGVDSYYLIHRATCSGYLPALLSEARKINDYMPLYIVNSLNEIVSRLKLNRSELTVTVLGVAFKENIADVRNSKAIEMIHLLQQEGYQIQVCDPVVEKNSHKQNFSFPLQPLEQLTKSHIVVLAVPHDHFLYDRSSFWDQLLPDKDGIIIDIKSVVPSHILHNNTTHWTL